MSGQQSERVGLVDRALTRLSVLPIVGKSAAEALENRAWERKYGKVVDALLERADAREKAARKDGGSLEVQKAAAIERLTREAKAYDDIYKNNEAGNFLRDVKAANARGEVYARGRERDPGKPWATQREEQER